MKRYEGGYLQDTIFKVELLIWNPQYRKDSELWENIESGSLNTQNTFRSRRDVRSYHTSSVNFNVKSKNINNIKPLKLVKNLKKEIILDLKKSFIYYFFSFNFFILIKSLV